MHLSGSSYRPALVSVDCPRVSGGLSRGLGSQGTSGRGRLPAGVASAPPSTDEETERRPGPGGRGRTGAIRGREVCSAAG